MRLALALALFATPALADDTLVVAPIFSQIVAAPLPDGFDAAFESSNGDFFIAESVPKGETVDAWRQMVTVTGFKGGAAEGVKALVPYAQNLAGRFSLACPKSFTTYQYGLGEIGVKGARGTIAILMGCGEIEVTQGPSPEGAEAAVIIFAVGSSDLYTFQWAERFAPDQGTQSFDPMGKWGDRLAALLANARLCVPVEGEVEPYPSCLE